MSFVTIDVDGTFTVHAAAPTSETIREHVAGWWDMVRLPYPVGRMRAFVNDDGHLVGLPRNIVGSLLLIACGAGHQPYAGTIVITGWDDDTEIEPLDGPNLHVVQELHRDLTAALAGEPVDGDVPAEWPEAARSSAEVLKSVPKPAIRILSAEDAVRFLMGDRS